MYLLMMALVVCADPHLGEPYFWIAMVLLAIGQAVRFWAAGHLVKNKALTTTGPYAHVKNPLYVGTFLILVGFCLAARGGEGGPWWKENMNWILLGVFLAGFLFYYVPYKKRREGNRLRDLFGAAWEEYDRAVPDYIPRLTPYRKPGSRPVRWSFKAVCENSEQWTPPAILAGVLAVVYNQHILEFFHGLTR